MKTDCAFCQIVRGELSAHVVLDEPHVIAFLDRSPIFHGHCLVVPRDHVRTLPDLPGDMILPLFSAAQRIAAAVEVALLAEGTFVAMNNKISQSVPHLHVHVVPRRKKDGLRGFFWPRVAYKSDEDMQLVTTAIRKELANRAE
ncbi:MAG: HIT family protein [Polyangiaceae bacterium]|nr:HIT family protein [Polyangiaceae bacterium]